MTRSLDEKDRASTGYASPPCFMHEVDPDYLGLPRELDAQQHADVQRWRKAERVRLIQARYAIGADKRRQMDEQIGPVLDDVVGNVDGVTISVYWPFKGEPDLRRWAERIRARGGSCALPVVVERNAPLVFRRWEAGAGLTRGVWNIPIPANGQEVTPEIVLAPVVGFDRACYRLGYGGGFFDRTLAAMTSRPRVIGIGYRQAAIPTIFPQAHDIPMDVIVTDEGIERTSEPPR